MVVWSFFWVDNAKNIKLFSIGGILKMIANVRTGA